MWWDRSKPLEVYLSERRLGVAWRASVPATWIDSANLDEALARLGDWLSADETSGIGRVRVWLSASLARPYMMGASIGARSQREAHILATTMASDTTGLAGASRVWLDRWREDRPALAVAIPEAVWQQLHAGVALADGARARASNGLRRRSLAVASVRPWWNLPFDHLLDECRRDSSRLGWTLNEGDGLLHGVIERGQLVEIGFDRPGPHDPTGGMLRRRLQANWGSSVPVRDLVFDASTALAPGSPHAIGAWHDAVGVPA